MLKSPDGYFAVCIFIKFQHFIYYTCEMSLIQAHPYITSQKTLQIMEFVCEMLLSLF